MKQVVYINDRNKLFWFRDRQIRTPAIIELDSKEVRNLLLFLEMQGIQNIRVKDSETIKVEISKEKIMDEEVIIEDLDLDIVEDKSSLLKELMNGEKK